MAVYDDLEQEKIKIYDKGIVAPPASGDFADFQISYRYGGSYSPFINEREPLKAECADFIRCVTDGCQPLTDGENGLAVVEVLEAANRSLSLNGAPMRVGEAVLDDARRLGTVGAAAGHRADRRPK
jgi:predicted dehydrogenase